MTEDVWSESNTSPDAIDTALRRMLHKRYAENQALAPARVLNLVVIVDRDWKGEISNRLAQVGRYHASRTILCAVEEGRTSLDAWAAMSYDDELEPQVGLARAVDLLDEAYVVDLAWLRTTPWRERLAASFDPPARRKALDGLDGITIRHRPSSRASALLLAGWLCSRLHWEPGGLESHGREGLAGHARRNGDRVTIELEAVDQAVPGLGGVTVSCGDGFALSLDRGPGGLQARARSGSDEQEWRVLGASRGEGGILGEGVRQALLRDPTYGPALDTARTFCQR